MYTNFCVPYTARKVSVFGVFLVPIFPHSGVANFCKYCDTFSQLAKVNTREFRN